MLGAHVSRCLVLVASAAVLVGWIDVGPRDGDRCCSRSAQYWSSVARSPCKLFTCSALPDRTRATLVQVGAVVGGWLASPGPVVGALPSVG